MRRTIFLLLLLCLALVLAACAGQGPSPAGEEEGPLRFGVVAMGPPVSDEIFYAERLAAEQEAAGGSQVFLTEWSEDLGQRGQEYNRDVIQGLLDEEMDGLVFYQAAPRIAETLTELEPDEDVFIALCWPNDGAMASAAVADLVLMVDEAAMGGHLAQKAYEMGADTLVYYYMERYFQDVHWQGIQMNLAWAAHGCAQHGMTFVPVCIANDGNAALNLKADPPKKVEEYGTDTAFFTPNLLNWHVSQEVLNAGAILPMLGYEAPYSSIQIPEEKYGDYDWANNQLKEELAASGTTAKVAAFPLDLYDLAARSALAYGELWISGEVERDRVDLSKLRRIMEGISGQPCILRYYEAGGVTYENYVLYSMEPVRLN